MTDCVYDPVNSDEDHDTTPSRKYKRQVKASSVEAISNDSQMTPNFCTKEGEPLESVPLTVHKDNDKT